MFVYGLCYLSVSKCFNKQQERAKGCCISVTTNLCLFPAAAIEIQGGFKLLPVDLMEAGKSESARDLKTYEKDLY